MEWYKILTPKYIKDGMKHTLYSRLINALIWLNPNITFNQVFSYCYHINSFSKKNEGSYWQINYISNYVKNIYDNIMETGEIRLKTKIKKIHFKMDTNLTPKDKMSLGAKINGALRTNNTIDLIQDAIMKLASQNIEPTNKNLVKLTGLSLATIKRNKNKIKKD